MHLGRCSPQGKLATVLDVLLVIMDLFAALLSSYTTRSAKVLYVWYLVPCNGGKHIRVFTSAAHDGPIPASDQHQLFASVPAGHTVTT